MTVGAPESIEERALLENDLIGVFVGVVQAFGLPKSVGEIYGLLYVSPEPLTMEQIRSRLGMSLGSASQGLKLLRSIRAVRVVYVPGQRRDYFQAEVELRQLLGGLYREQMEPQLDTIARQLKQIQPQVERLGSDGAHLRARFERLDRWRRQSSRWISRIVRLFAD